MVMTFPKSIVTSCCILTVGMMYHTHLKGLFELHKLHIDLKDKHKINYNDCYWHYFNFSLVFGISGIFIMNKLLKY